MIDLHPELGSIEPCMTTTCMVGEEGDYPFLVRGDPSQID